MSFTIPNEADAAFPAQAKIDAGDIVISGRGHGLTGVITGCAVTAQGTPNTTVAVGSGLIRIHGELVVVTAGTVTGLTADATNPRFYLISVDSAAVKTAVAGTAHATNPVYPTVPADTVILAAVYVPGADTAVNTNQIVDKRVVVSANNMYLARKTTTTTYNTTAAEETLWSVLIPGGLLVPGDKVVMELDGDWLQNSGAGQPLSHLTTFGATTPAYSTATNFSNVATRGEYTGTLTLKCLTSSSQSLAFDISHNTAGAQMFGAHSTIWAGSAVTSEDTSVDKVLAWKAKFGTAHALAEITAKAGTAQLFKAVE